MKGHSGPRVTQVFGPNISEAPAEAPLTPEQQERAAMLQRRSSFMRDLRDGNVEEDVIAAASRAKIFVDYN